MSNEITPIEIIQVDGSNPKEFMENLELVLNKYSNVHFRTNCPNEYTDEIDCLKVYRDTGTIDGHIIEIGYYGFRHLNDIKYCYGCGTEYTGFVCPNCKDTVYTNQPNSQTKKGDV